MLNKIIEVLGGFKNLSIELEKSDINVTSKGFSLQLKDNESKNENDIKLIEDKK